ncbi:hypothetical protein [Spiroplasma citri]|uniref:Transmembrane protein n=2 Tax=Spiroplasma citri TaxID=2133 RepID=A0AAJ4EKT1_SPICI|nr:hypothetical protein [Spiroplasma citri]QIA69692.1 hypothetical protein GL298_09830 [Spiroplasma citri]QIA75679.1 hypothetical protein GTU57_08900 [Spiroplasma citri]
MMVVLSQTMRIQIIPRTSIPLFLIPIFISGIILNWYWCLLIGIMGHFLSDLTLWGFTVGSLCWNIGTGLLAVLIKLINWIKINHSIKIILILLANIIIYLPIDFMLFLIKSWCFKYRTNNYRNINYEHNMFTNFLFYNIKN